MPTIYCSDPISAIPIHEHILGEKWISRTQGAVPFYFFISPNFDDYTCIKHRTLREFRNFGILKQRTRGSENLFGHRKYKTVNGSTLNMFTVNKKKKKISTKDSYN